MGKHRRTIAILTGSEKEHAPLVLALARENMSARVFQSEKTFFDSIYGEMVDLILLDDSHLKRRVLDVSQALLSDERTRHIPIIIVSSESSISDIVSCFEIGVADYVLKPYDLKILIARIRASMRRILKEALQYDIEVFHCGKLTVHLGRMEVKVDGVEISLTLSEFRLLSLLAARPGWVYSREQIIQELGGNEEKRSERTVDVLIVCLRRKLLDAGRMIQTVRGIGYRLQI
jgi:two-component system phosphate regulon response regulator PhoB